MVAELFCEDGDLIGIAGRDRANEELCGLRSRRLVHVTMFSRM